MQEKLKMSHPYQKYENTIIWDSLNSIVDKLVENGDMQEMTSRKHLIGYMINILDKENCLNNSALNSKDIKGNIK